MQSSLCQKKCSNIIWHKVSLATFGSLSLDSNHRTILKHYSLFAIIKYLILHLLAYAFLNSYINGERDTLRVRQLIKGLLSCNLEHYCMHFACTTSCRQTAHHISTNSGMVMIFFAKDNHNAVATTIRKRSGDNSTYTEYGTIFYNNKPTINIADPCNGLEFLLLYAWFILVMPGTLRRRIIFLAGGLLLLHLSNLLRCWGLVEIYRQYRHSFDFAHHYLFKIIIYGLSFLLWYWYLKALKQQPQQADEN